MTRWRGESAFVNIGPGTAILFFPHPSIAGEPLPDFAVGDEIEIRLGGPREPWVNAEAMEISPDGVIIQTEDGARWLMTPRQNNELGSNITWQGGPSQDWIIRAQG
jgi:hypothetical protein